MKDLSDRFAETEPKRQAEARPDPLARLQQAPPDSDARLPPPRPWLRTLLGRSGLIAAGCALLAAALVLWPMLHPAAVQLPPVAETGDQAAAFTVQPLSEDGVATAPDWAALFNAYQLETSLRDISIRCNYGLPADARVDRYLHARLMPGTQIRIFLADPGVCPKM